MALGFPLQKEEWIRDFAAQTLIANVEQLYSGLLRHRGLWEF